MRVMIRRLFRYILFALITILAIAGVDAFAASPSDGALFQSTIAPILQNRCLKCHNSNNAKGKLALVSLASALEGGKSGAAIVVGSPDESELVERIETGDMPEEGPPLTEDEIRSIRKWLDAGASWPEEVVLRQAPKADRSWWAYQKLGKSTLQSIDAHVEAKLTENGLRMNGPASQRDLIRRVSYDVTGLPPSAEEMDAFVAESDQHPDTAYAALVDRLLASPRYGERWGRHWLDVTRFGESIGYERNDIINNIWPFRDYVIRSLNNDKPFDVFIREHLAGDVIGRGDPDVEVAVAFLVAGPFDDVGNQDAAQAALIRANALDDMITATGSAFLGMTINCAKCHDHKFDPIEQKDYYRMRAAFEGVRHEDRVLATDAERRVFEEATRPLNERKERLEKSISDLENEIMARAVKQPELLPPVTRARVDRTRTVDEFEPIRARAVRLTPFSNDVNPVGNGFGIDEFEVWTDEPKPRNVALAANGGVATGAARAVEDSEVNAMDAYGPVLVNDGAFGRRWRSAGDHTLTIRFAQSEIIRRIVFSSDRPAELPDHAKMVFVGEYRLEASEDGKNWRTVSESWDRTPLNDGFLRQRRLRFATTDEDKKELRDLRRELTGVKRQLRAVKPLRRVWAGQFSQPDGPTFLARGGDPNRPAGEVVPASLKILDGVVPGYTLRSDAPEDVRRLELARWITHPSNPLTTRVLANRVWQYHFGSGLVRTSSDFGFMAGDPSHPELLDYLARRLLEFGWRLKPLHREILLSRAYQQSTDYREGAAAKDSDARFLWRFPPRRLSAEEIRDSLLAYGGMLDLSMGGRGFRLYKVTRDNVSTYIPLDEHGPETWRRAVYHQNARAANTDLLTEFDCPDPAFATPRRASTTTPLQALTLMNHSFSVDMANQFAGRLRAHSIEPLAQVERAFAIVYVRPPSNSEQAAAVALINKHGLPAFTRALFNSNELIYLR